MTAAAKNAWQKAREEHNRDMKEIRALIKKLTPAKVRAFKAKLRKARSSK